MKFVVDFTKYMDGTPTKPGDVIYLVNTMKMITGRMWDNPPAPAGPVLQGPDGEVRDRRPPRRAGPEHHPASADVPDLSRCSRGLEEHEDNRRFELQRGSGDAETEWLINGQSFDPATPVRSLVNKAGKSPSAGQKMDCTTCGRSATVVAAGCTRCTCTWKNTAS